ncbi:MAG TPA: hypothetical protein DEO57_00535, partial [Phycisphaerales bacterium]|nr:hypothetical protein [Phycisphaerales bacterium]
MCTLATAAPGGEVQSWGSDTYGQSTVPSGDNFVQVTCGYFFSMGLLEDGTIVHWGMATSGVDDVPEGDFYTAIEAGHSYVVAIKTDGTLDAWGWNGGGQLGHPSG